jgi:hypothetical protein
VKIDRWMRHWFLGQRRELRATEPQVLYAAAICSTARHRCWQSAPCSVRKQPVDTRVPSA